MEHLDGNAAAALLEQAFGRDVTAAAATCAHCGATEALARAHVYSGGPGTVVRCAHCSGVLVRLAWTGRLTVDRGGLAALA
jgi:hypothetical protein